MTSTSEVIAPKILDDFFIKQCIRLVNNRSGSLILGDVYKANRVTFF